ncbi:hypothetical protein HDK90DRAFT_429666 [Phyllosticta capitalensis]|uniref:glucosamine-6-phosphate deaminase n=1 Tax=Phyllosticta capitalensis TaxID=121624 RepID=A0ABR1Z4E7_9PEZI
MRLIIRDDPTAASQYIADYIVERIKAFDPTPERPFVLGLPTGSSPEIIYKILVEKYKKGEVSFQNVVTFNMDEYVNLPRDHPQSYHTFMYTHLFSHTDLPPSQTHLLNGNAANLAAECARYEALVRSYGGIELFLAGIGSDGHIAFNEPGSSLASRTRVKTLAYDTQLANARFFGGDVGAVPSMALTVGVGTVLDAREVVAIVTGAHKATALQRCVEDGVSHMWTLSALQMHPHAMVVADDDATLELKVKTVKYFRSIERVATREGMLQVLGDPRAEQAMLRQVEDEVAAMRRAEGVPAARGRKDSLMVTPTKTKPPGESQQQQATMANSSTAEHKVPLLNPNPHPTSRSLSRSTTPEPSLDRMGSRISPVEPPVASIDDEIEFQRMGARVVNAAPTQQQQAVL